MKKFLGFSESVSDVQLKLDSELSVEREKELIVLAKSGDDAAVKELLQWAKPLVEAVVKQQKLSKSDEAHLIIGDILEEALNDFHEFSGNRLSFYLTVRLNEHTAMLSLVHQERIKFKAQRVELGLVQEHNMCKGLHFNFIEYNEVEEYKSKSENRFTVVEKEPLSTFSIDVDTASYSNMRRYINQGQLPPPDAIRTEELVNYFTYDYRQPKDGAPVCISAETGRCPWNGQNRLVRIALKSKEIDRENLPASNFVFLIDVSGSMWGLTRLELVKSSLGLLIDNLRSSDRIAIVTFADDIKVALPSTPGSDRQKIREAVNSLYASGGTSGGEGIQTAYKIAFENFVKGGNNRIILCTDGDFNIGVSSPEGLEKLIASKRDSGVYLTILGYGMGNYKDNRIQALAEKGRGNHAYIDTLQEANKVLIREFGGTLYTVAKDVKLQIEFNPAQVQAYRLLGYESRRLAAEDFNNDQKEAGTLGAGHRVTAFYETVPVGIPYHGNVDSLKYQPVTAEDKQPVTDSEELMNIKLRYKLPEESTSSKIELPVIDLHTDEVSSDFYFASAVAMFGQILTESEHKGDATFDKVIELAKTALDPDESGYRREFVRLVEAAKGAKPYSEQY